MWFILFFKLKYYFMVLCNCRLLWDERVRKPLLMKLAKSPGIIFLTLLS